MEGCVYLCVLTFSSSHGQCQFQFHPSLWKGDTSEVTVRCASRLKTRSNFYTVQKEARSGERRRWSQWSIHLRGSRDQCMKDRSKNKKGKGCFGSVLSSICAWCCCHRSDTFFRSVFFIIFYIIITVFYSFVLAVFFSIRHLSV